MQFRDLISRLDSLSEDTIGTIPVQLDQTSIDKLKTSNPTLYQQILKTNPELAMATQTPVAGSVATLAAPTTPGATTAQGTTGTIAPQGAPGQQTTNGNTSSQIPGKQEPIGSNTQQPMQGKRPQESFDSFKDQMGQVVEELIGEELSPEEKARRAKAYADKVNKNLELLNSDQFRGLDPADQKEIVKQLSPTAKDYIRTQRELDAFNAGKDQPTAKRDELLVKKNQALAAHQDSLKPKPAAPQPAEAPPAPVTPAKPAEAPPAPVTPAKPVAAPVTPEKPVAAPVTPEKPVEKKKFDLGPGAWHAGTDGDYDIQKGDTLGQIAKTKGVSLDQLKQWNNIENVNKILAGAKLKTVAPEAPPAVVPPEAPSADATPVDTSQTNRNMPAAKTDVGVDRATLDKWKEEDLAKLQKELNTDLNKNKTESIVRLDSVVEELLNEAGTATMPMNKTDDKSVWQSTKDAVGKGVDAVKGTIPEPVKDVASKVANHPVTKVASKAFGPAMTALSAPQIPTDARRAFELSDEGDKVGAWLKGGQAALNTAMIPTTAAALIPSPIAPAAAVADAAMGIGSLGLMGAEYVRDKYFPYKGKETADTKPKSANEELNRVLTLTQYKVGN